MKNSIEISALDFENFSTMSKDIKGKNSKEIIKSRLGFIYIVALMTSFVILFL